MQLGTKPQLVLTHSFPTNSIILSGLIEYLSGYFEVHFIDLPGFRKNIPPLEDISIKNYAEYLEQEIEKLELEEYVLGGISFSHCVVSMVRTDSSCKAILALEPYINRKSLVLSKRERLLYKFLINSVSKLGIYQFVWNEKIIGCFLKFQDKNILRTIVREIDARTFFETSRLIFSYEGMNWQKKPHVLAANENDDRVDWSYNLEQFKRHVKVLYVFRQHTDHFPPVISREYYAEIIPETEVKAMLTWLQSH